MIFSNLEKSETWEKIKAKKHSKIIAHYLLSYLNGEKTFIQNVAKVLAEGGMFSVNHYGEAAKEYDYWENVLEDVGIDKTFALKKREERRQMDIDFEALLEDNKRIIEEYFDNVVLKDGPVAIDMDSVFYHCYK